MKVNLSKLFYVKTGHLLHNDLKKTVFMIPTLWYEKLFGEKNSSKLNKKKFNEDSEYIIRIYPNKVEIGT